MRILPAALWRINELVECVSGEQLTERIVKYVGRGYTEAHVPGHVVLNGVEYETPPETIDQLRQLVKVVV